MKNRLLFGGALLSFVAMAMAQSWVDVKDKTGGFSAKFPSKPKKMVQDFESEVGKVEVTIYMSAKGNRVFYASWNNFPTDKGKIDPKAALRGAARGMAAGDKNYKLLAEGKAQGTHFISIEFSKQSNGKTFSGIAKCFFRNARFYQAFVMDEGGFHSSLRKDAKTFLDAFKVTAK